MFDLGLSTAQGAGFELVVRTASGAVETRDIKANDAAAACAIALREGLQVLACKPRRRATETLRPASSVQSGRNHDIANFSFEFSLLLSAGLSVIDALETLKGKEVSPTRRAELTDLVQSISEGLPLSGALALHPNRYPPLLIATVISSEQTGNLSAALIRFSEHQKTIKALREKALGAAVYPLLLLLVGFFVVLFLMTVVVPKFALLIESANRELPWSSQLLMSWGRFAAANGWVLGGIGLLSMLAIARAAIHTSRNGGRSPWLDAMPIVGPTIQKFRRAQLYRTTGMLVGGGIALARALQLANDLLGDADQRRLKKAIVLLNEGRKLSDALQSAELADPVAISMLCVAERTGGLAEILERIAQFHEATLQRSVEMMSRLFEPVLMIGIGLLVGSIVVLMYLPIFDLASSLQ